MAKIKLSSVGITNISGKAGGSIYSRNRGGAYVKNFAMPTNPNTEFQQNIRNIFGGISQAWRALTEEQRQSFVTMAPLYTAKNVFGDSMELTGFSLHQKLNANLLLNGQNSLRTAIPPLGTPPIITASVVATLSGSTLTISLTGSADRENFTGQDLAIVVSGAPPTSPSRSFQKDNFRFLTSSTLPVTGNLATPLAVIYPARFYTPAVGQEIYLRVQILNLSSGELSAPVEASSILVDTTP